MSQLSLDFVEQGIPTLWGSFEVKNTRLVKKMLQQFNRDTLPQAGQLDGAEILDEIGDGFKKLPFYWMTHHGATEIEEVIAAMEYTFVVNDAQVVILDNMQFMITRKGNYSSFDKFETQDTAIALFREFATKNNIHVILVCHPKKGVETLKLGIDSFYGSAKVTQEADNVLIVQKDASNKKIVEVKKNRFDGNLGYCPLYFEHSSGRYLTQPSTRTPDSPSGKSEARRVQLRPKIQSGTPKPAVVDNKKWHPILEDK